MAALRRAVATNSRQLERHTKQNGWLEWKKDPEV